MNKKAQILYPRSVVFVFGCAILGYILFESLIATFIGAIIGGIISFSIK